MTVRSLSLCFLGTQSKLHVDREAVRKWIEDGRCAMKVLQSSFNAKALELKRVAPEFSTPYSILRGNTLILPLRPNFRRDSAIISVLPAMFRPHPAILTAKGYLKSEIMNS
jgi:hypothetical protein